MIVDEVVASKPRLIELVDSNLPGGGLDVHRGGRTRINCRLCICNFYPSLSTLLLLIVVGILIAYTCVA